MNVLNGFLKDGMLYNLEFMYSEELSFKRKLNNSVTFSRICVKPDDV